MVILTTLFILFVPSFPNTVLQYHIEEELPLNTVVGNLRLDSNISTISAVPPQELQFSLLGDPDRDVALRYLSINSTSSALFISRFLDREEVCDPTPECQLMFGVAAHSGQYFHMITVYIDIDDLNDNIPTFSKDEISIAINENTMIGFKYTLPAAVDMDTDSYGVQRYSLESTYGVFAVEYEQQVKLVITGNLDRETTRRYQLRLLAYDGGFPPNAGLLFINVTVVDRNDNVPVFNKSEIHVSLPENISVPVRVATVLATDRDSGSNGLVHYSLSQNAQDILGHVFEMDAASGEIYLIQNLDYETRTRYSFEVKAFDQGATSLSSFAMVDVEVLDINDNAPRITITSLSNNNLPIILENSNPGVFVAHVTVSDDDSGANGDVTCNITDSHFRLEPLWGSQYQVLTTSTFDREAVESYEVELVCHDLGSPPMDSRTSFRIYIGDENDNRPVFNQSLYSASVPENNPIDGILLTIVACDLDVGNNGRVSYTVLGSASQSCYVDDTTGAVKASVVLDYESVKTLEFTVQATDDGSPALSATTAVHIIILDQNDEPPVFAQDAYTFSTPENQPGGRFVGAVSATDPDTVSPQDIRYFFQVGDNLQTGDIGAFRLNSISGQIETDFALDREDRAIYNVVVSSSNSDNTSFTSTVEVSIQVTDENDNSPVFTYPTADNNTVLLTGPLVQEHPVAVLRAVDPDEGVNSQLSYILLENDFGQLFTVGTSTGVITLPYPPVGSGFQVYQLGLMVRDNGIPPRNSTTFFYVALNGSISNAPTARPRSPGGSTDNGGDDEDQVLTGSSLTAFICIVSIAGVVITLLLAAIVFVLLRSKRRKRQDPHNGHLPGVVAVNGTGSTDSLNNNLSNMSFQSEDETTGVEETQLQGRDKVTQGQGHHDGVSVKACSPTNILLSPPGNPPNYMQVCV